MKKNKGFSLIELLIVITIVGVLTTIILGSVSNSRARTYDSKIKQQLSNFRTAAELYFTNQMPNGYGPATSDCNDNNGMFKNLTPVNGQPGKFIDPVNLPSFAKVICQSTDTAYAVKVKLYFNNEYWCVDNKGASRLTTDNSLTTFCS